MNKKGLNIHYYENKKNLVIFIHGLFGSDATWENDSKEYLSDILYSRREIRGNFDLSNFNYNSTITKIFGIKKKYQLTIEELAEGLKSEIKAHAEKYENIILIGHSMGGLIAKQYLLKNLDDHKVKLYISIATPHLGSNIANFIKAYNHPQIMDLKRNNNYLVNLNREWINREKELPKSFYLYGLEDKVVVKESAVPSKSVEEKYILGFMEDHNSIVKLGESSTLFKYLVTILNDFYFKANPEKVLYLNNSKKILNEKGSFNQWVEEGYQIVEALPEKERNEIFNYTSGITTTLKKKEKFEDFLKRLQSELEVYVKSTSKIIYTGIPLVPLTFLEGYLMREITDRKYLVNYRDHQNLGYEELKYGNKEVLGYKKSSLSEIPEGHEEVSIALSSSFKVQVESITSCKGSPVLTYNRIKLEKDHITHYKEVEKIADEFLEYVLLLKNEKNIKRINLFAAIPVPLSYEIARKIQNHYPTIYVYHYEDNKYEWGINIKTGELEIL